MSTLTLTSPAGYLGRGSESPTPANAADTSTGDGATNASCIRAGVPGYAWVIGRIAFGYQSGPSSPGQLIVRQLLDDGVTEDFQAMNIPITSPGAGEITVNKVFKAGRPVEVLLTADSQIPSVAILSSYLTPAS